LAVRLGERARVDCIQVEDPVGVLGRPTSPSDGKPGTLVFVKIAEGSCIGYELTIDQRYLTDFGDTIRGSDHNNDPAAPR